MGVKQKVDEKVCVATTMKTIGSKWTVLVLHQLFHGTKRFGELQRSLDGISPKTLSLRLHQLEKNGIIKKKIYPEIPLHVEYSLTERGHSLGAIIRQMYKWGEKSLAQSI